jgi:hypothetical protein
VCAFYVSTWSFTLREELTRWSETASFEEEERNKCFEKIEK